MQQVYYSALTKKRKKYVLLLLALLTSVFAQAQTIRYVTTTGTNTDPATAISWATSTTNLQGAINASAAGDQVWVAAGTYKPGGDNNRNRTVSFAMKLDVSIYGGFAATGNPIFADRSPNTYPTILSGDIDNNGQLDAGNSRHVIFNNNNDNGFTGTRLLDGFTITGGYMDDDNGEPGGAAIYNNYSSTLRLVNCIIQNNRANGGAALWNTGSYRYPSGNIALINCIIRDNLGGKAIVNFFTNTVLTNCTISNSSATGGAIYNGSRGSTSLRNCIIWNCGGQNTIFNEVDNTLGGGSTSLYYSLVEPEVVNYTSTSNVITTTFPFVSTTDLRLNMSSPAINRGLNSLYAAALGPTTDLVGNSRIQSSIIDLGALESAYTATPLPVTLINFTANRYSNVSVGIEWQTSLEIDSDYFELQRSLDAKEFTFLTKLKAQGTTNQKQNYRYLDNQPLTQPTYYRLRMVDLDGKWTYSNIVAVTPDSDQPLLRLVENPVSQNSFLRVWLWGYQPGELRLYRLTGQPLGIQVNLQSDGTLGIVVNESLSPGIYVLEANDGRIRQSQRIAVH